MNKEFEERWDKLEQENEKIWAQTREKIKLIQENKNRQISNIFKALFAFWLIAILTFLIFIIAISMKAS